MATTIRLQQGQVWHQGDLYLRIVRLERLEVEFKQMTDIITRDGTHHTVSKKEFCRIIKNATLIPQKQSPPGGAESNADLQSAPTD